MTTPTGIITEYYGTLASIPTGWQNCDGTNGTPDLRNAFVCGANNDGEVGTTSGCSSHTHSLPYLNTGGDHTHGINGTSGTSNTSGLTTSTGGGANITDPHSHSFSGTLGSTGGHSHASGISGSSAVSPPYRKLYYIMKL